MNKTPVQLLGYIIYFKSGTSFYPYLILDEQPLMVYKTVLEAINVAREILKDSGLDISLLESYIPDTLDQIDGVEHDAKQYHMNYGLVVSYPLERRQGTVIHPYFEKFVGSRVAIKPVYYQN